jgi:hypothetical protein
MRMIMMELVVLTVTRDGVEMQFGAFPRKA